MSNSHNKKGRGNDTDPDKPYVVGNKKPPLQTRFKPGQTGNPSGRPKGRPKFAAILMDEFYRTVPATINGKPVKKTQARLFARSIVMDGITKGPQSKRILANKIERAEAQLAAEGEARKKAEAEEPVAKFSWTEAHERMMEELERRAAELGITG
jgi:hypothetical protein